MPSAIQDWQSQSRGHDFLVVRAFEPSTKESRVRIHVRASSYQNVMPFAWRIKQRCLGILPEGHGVKRPSPLGSKPLNGD
jgi:hypothetical protein